MRGDEVSDQIESDSAPNGAEDVAQHALQPAQEADGVVDLWKVLEQEGDKEHRHHFRCHPSA